MPRRTDAGHAQVILGRGSQADHGGLGFGGDGTIDPGGGIGGGGGVLHHIALGPFHPVPMDVDLAVAAMNPVGILSL